MTTTKATTSAPIAPDIAASVAEHLAPVVVDLMALATEG